MIIFKVKIKKEKLKEKISGLEVSPFTPCIIVIFLLLPLCFLFVFVLFLFVFFFKILLEIIYHVVFVSTAQQSESIIFICIF